MMKKLFALSFAALLASSPAFADSTINALGAGSAVAGTDIFPAYQGTNPATGVTAGQITTYSQQAGYADDQILIGSGANAASLKTIPNCVDTGGNHLNYTQSTNTVSCGTSGGATSPFTYQAGYFYETIGWYARGARGGVANILVCSIAELQSNGTLTSLSIPITTLAAGGNIAGFLYAHDATNNRPTGTPLASTGALSTAATGWISTTGLSVALTKGPIWMCENNDTTAGSTVNVDGIGLGSPGMAQRRGAVSLATLTNNAGSFIQTLNYNAQTFSGTGPDLTSVAPSSTSLATPGPNLGLGF